MKEIRYRFEISYQTKIVEEVSDFLRKCDLAMEYFYIKDIMTFTYLKDEKPIDYFKELIIAAFHTMDLTVIKIEGGRVE